MPVMNLKPLRNVNEHDVIPFFALDSVSGDMGQLVKIKTGWVNGVDLDYVNLFQNVDALSQRPVVHAKVEFGASGEGAAELLGMLLWNVREYNYLGVPMIYDRTRQTEAMAVASGEGVPIVTKGLFLVSGYTGTAGAGSGAIVDNAGNGVWVVTSSQTNSIGKFLGGADTDGFALFKLNL